MVAVGIPSPCHTQCFAVTKKPEIIDQLSKEDKEIAMTIKAAAEARQDTPQPVRRRRAAPAPRQPRRARRRVSYDSSSDTTSDEDLVVEDADADDPTDDDAVGARRHKQGMHLYNHTPSCPYTVRRQPRCQSTAPPASQPPPTPVMQPAGSTGYAQRMYQAPFMPAAPSLLLPAMSYDSFDPLALLRSGSGTSLSTVTLPGGSVALPWPAPSTLQGVAGKGPVTSVEGVAGKGLVTNPWAAVSQTGWGAAERGAVDGLSNNKTPQLFSTLSLLQHAPSIALLPGASTLLPQGTSTLLHLDDLLQGSEVHAEGLWPPSTGEALGPRLVDRVHDSANLSLGFLGTTPTPSGLQLLSDLLQGLGEAPKDDDAGQK